MNQHNWVASTLGHGETMCSKCYISNREAAVLGLLNICDVPDQDESVAKDVNLGSQKMWSDKAVEDAARELYDRVIVGGDGYEAARDDVKTCWREYARAALDAAAAVDGDALRNAVLDEAHDLCVRQEQSDIAYGKKYPDEALNQDIRAHRCRTLAAEILSLKKP